MVGRSLLLCLAALATVCSTVSGYELRPLERRRNKSNRHNRRSYQEFDVDPPRSLKRPARRVIGAPPKDFSESDLTYDIESPIFNAPLPVSNEDEFRQASMKRYKAVQTKPVPRYSPENVNEGIVNVPMKKLIAEDLPPIYRSRINAESENNNPRILRKEQQTTRQHSLESTRREVYPLETFKNHFKTESPENKGQVRSIQFSNPLEIPFDQNVENEDKHPNHRYRDETMVDPRQTYKEVSHEQHKQENRPQQHRPREQNPHPMQPLQPLPRQHLTQQRKHDQHEHHEHKSLQLQSVEHQPRYPSNSNERQVRRPIPNSQRAQISDSDYVEFQRKQKQELLHYKIKQQQKRKQELKTKQQEKLFQKQYDKPKPTISNEEQPSQYQEVSRPSKISTKQVQSDELNPVRNYKNPISRSGEGIPMESHKRHAHVKNYKTPTSQNREESPGKRYKSPIPLVPVYGEENLKSSAEEHLSLLFPRRPDNENEPINYIPEFRETLSKEKRQAHHGGYEDPHGVQFAAEASAAELSHGHSDDGRLTFQLHGQKGPHSYRFGFDTGKGPHRQFRYEERDNDGSVKGRYGYYDSHGKLKMYNYSAHPEHGYSAAEAH